MERSEARIRAEQHRLLVHDATLLLGVLMICASVALLVLVCLMAVRLDQF